ncbi:hypothetical protein [Vibrio hepatarius]|uniref:hypothetical protein n=1 Tax=Vibrio hepatarius TaxID=171383 RepID=UPI00142DB35E|nr:hypothetical protein [Vibrio hepatarius]NIY83005.1 hypothetical protein [Vibrio hepatarius]NVJ58036.1 hypothetical protein [Vibrionaceae bacterium]
MKSILKVIHLLSFAVFLGSISTYIFFGEIIAKDDLVAMGFNRDWVSTGTAYLTIGSMWITGITGMLMSGVPKKRWLWAKVFGFILIVLNTYIFIYPAIVLSRTALNDNSELFQSAMLQEAIFGAVNLLLIIILVAVATLKPKLRR